MRNKWNVLLMCARGQSKAGKCNGTQQRRQVKHGKLEIELKHTYVQSEKRVFHALHPSIILGQETEY